ncbi:uncharacterized protein LOC115884763 [Sitophilus oryzae]|uniref:Uncharacterized protein LOC115884763 n=1 Tax=Sitophilus oryzae TaxID=7048 RepID=A0A6J2Y6P8_SITOR|nr:uncharacterized protein LOC115884763 [Sitophilus oryzae]
MENTIKSWVNKGECTICGIVSNHLPLYNCPENHKICGYCYNELKYVLKEHEAQVMCKECENNGKMTHYELDLSTFNKMKNLPNYQNLPPDEEDHMFKLLIGMTKEAFYSTQEALNKEQDKQRNDFVKSRTCFSISKRPLKCLHRRCHQAVALAQFVNHFKLEHKDVEICSAQKSKEILFPFNVSKIENGRHVCISMLTVYEVNQIDLRTASSESIAKTCHRFCQKIPVDTFWLMVTGSIETKTSAAYCVFWLFTNSDNSHRCTLELGSARDSISLSTYCAVSSAWDTYDFSTVLKELRCLIVTKQAIKSMLKEGVVLNLRVNVH